VRSQKEHLNKSGRNRKKLNFHTNIAEILIARTIAKVKQRSIEQRN
jgi:hypothetical protein